MITDTLDNAVLYYRDNEVFNKAIEHIQFVLEKQKYEEGITEIMGRDMYARIMSYPLKTREAARYEAHKDYIDIQATLIGAEGMEWCPLGLLSPKTEYNSDKDVTFFELPQNPRGRIDVFPGQFALFFPEDVHMPQLIVENCDSSVVKIVIKIRKTLFMQ